MARKPVKYFVVDAFTDTAFKGNPAAICLLEEERDEKWLKNLAAEFNICLTCYLIPINEDEEEEEEEDDHSISPPKFSLRWFNPEAEAFLFY
uniref:Isomerase BH0283-like protein n=1 Tax=Cucumis melo TaxID=3656 RepID=A0A9I9DC09_CUCME